MKIKLTLMLLLLATITGCATGNYGLLSLNPTPYKEILLEGRGYEKTLLINIDGVIDNREEKGFLSTEPGLVQRVVAQLDLAARDKNIKAVLLKVNSPGGTVTSSDILYYEIMSFKKRTGKKIVVIMMDVAASGGYYVSLPADFIMAHPTTITGSVGAIATRPEFYKLLDKIGVGVHVNKSGRNKDMGSAYREQTGEDKKLLQGLIDNAAMQFVDKVVSNRGIKGDALEKVKTARVFVATEAKELGLIDGIGYMDDAIARAKNVAGMADNAALVTYRKMHYPNDNVYNASSEVTVGQPVSGIELKIPESMNRAGLYYLWPTSIGK